jgi:hypothetical protein
MGRACSTNGEKRNAYRTLVGKPEDKRPLGRPRRRWVDNIVTHLSHARTVESRKPRNTHATIEFRVFIARC